MTTFRYKPDKIKYLTSINTLDTLHRKRVLEFESRRKRSDDIRNEISKLESDQSQMEKPMEKSETNTVIDIKQRSYIKSRIQKLKQELFDIENNISELEYYSQTNDILLDYYHEAFPTNTTLSDNVDYSGEEMSEQQELVVEEEERDGIPNRIMEGSPNDLASDEQDGEMDSSIPNDNNTGKLKLEELNYRSQQKRKPKKVTKRRVRKNDIQNRKSILDFFSDKATEEQEETDDKEQKESCSCIEQEVSNKATLFDYYMTLIDKTYVGKNKRNCIRVCTKCNVEKTLIQSDGFYVCQECGEVENAIIESEIPSHKDSVVEKHIFPYKRQNHLSEFCEPRRL